MAGATKLLTPGGGAVIVQPASSIASDVTVQVPARAGNLMMDGPAFFATMTANISVSTGTYTLMQFNTVSATNNFDTNSKFNTGTYTFTPNVAGYYQVTVSAAGPNASAGSLGVVLYKNGTRYGWLQAAPNVSGGINCTGTTLVYLNGSTDYIQAYCYQSTGSTQTIYSGYDASYFQASYVRGA